MKKILGALLVAVGVPYVAFAGGWSSGGGDNIRDAQNPWFLKNTSAVTYCIEVDQSSVSGSSQNFQLMVKRAIDDWRKIFSDYQSQYPKNAVQIGTQQWTQVKCDEQSDVKFKFGWNTLNQKEKHYLSTNGDSLEHIAVAVRTDYDQVKLKSEGFIYLASDVGSHAFNLEPGQISQPWQYPTLVYLELIHELGHVFGIPHVSSQRILFSERWIMSEHFPEMVLQNWIWKQNAKGLQDPGKGLMYFFEPQSYRSCYLQKETKQWLEVSDNVTCLEIKLDGTENPKQIEITASDDQGHVIVQFDPIKISEYEFLTPADISVYLTQKQSVFPMPPVGELPIVTGPGTSNGELSGKLVLPSGVSKSAMFLKRDDSLKIIGLDASFDAIRTLVSASPKDASSSGARVSH